MSIRFFGLDIAQIVGDAIASAGDVLPVTLTKITPDTRDAADITGGLRPTPQDYEVRGFFQNATSERIGNSLVSQSGEFVSILGSRLPENIEPESNDRVTIEGRNYLIIEVVSRDPAAALYVCSVQEK